MNIYVIVGSNNSSSVTYDILESVLNNLSNENDISYVADVLCKMNISFCKGCQNCFDTGLCELDVDDDMKIIKTHLLHADIIIFASPVYVNNITGKMKAVFDRLSYWTHLFKLSNKKGAVITVSKSSGNVDSSIYLNNMFLWLGVRSLATANFVALENLDMYGKVCPDSFNAKLIKKIQILINYKGSLSDNRLEAYFLSCQNYMKYLRRKSLNTYETNYWITEGLLDATSYADFLLTR